MRAIDDIAEEDAPRRVLERALAHPFFSGMSQGDLAVLAGAIESGAARSAKFASGDVIFRQGDPANRFYLIESGKVQLEFHEPGDGTFPVAEVAAREALGFAWLFAPFLWTLQARAVEATGLIELDGAHLLITSEQNKAFGHELLKRVGKLAIARLEAVRREYVKSARELEAVRLALEQSRAASLT